MRTGRPRRDAIALGLAGLAVAALGLALLSRGDSGGRDEVQASVAGTSALGGDATGFARATMPREFVFPADHGPHPEFRTEWWYYTGNLATRDHRHFGFQLTFFRVALVPEGRPRASAWASTHVYLAHFAVTDTVGRRFRASSRTSRGALALAGAQASPFRVWVEDWLVEGEHPSGLPMRLRAAEADAAIDLTLESSKPAVLQGERGLSHKGPEAGNASYYYSLTRMPTRGTVRIGTDTFTVTGSAWMDREWSTSALGPDLVGWDWFALQLEDGRDLMFYQLRRRDGQADPFSRGSIVAPDGSARPLALEEVRLEVLGTWTSPASGVRYPSGWRLAIPAADLTLEITPRLRDQELRVGVRYWEGAVTVRSVSVRSSPIAGLGYVELVGYGK
jgi:predicted secreted hydrolase